MADDKEKRNKQKEDYRELKEKTGDLVKAAGGVAGSFGKIASKKGKEFASKIEDGSIQESVRSGVKDITDKAGNIIHKDNIAKGEYISEEIEATVEVEGNETVEFDTKRIKKGPLGAIDKTKERRNAKKEEHKQLREEQERKRIEESAKALRICAIVVIVCFAILGIMAYVNGRPHPGKVQPPFSYSDVEGLNYAEVVKE